mgnify:FL=1
MIFFLSVLLLMPTGARACWDDDWDDWEDTGSWDDDDWYDDSWYDDDWYDDDDDIAWDETLDGVDIYPDDNYDDDDIAWDETLDGVDIYPDEDYDWGLDDDWWRTDYSDDDDFSDDDDEYQSDDDDDNTGSSSQTGGNSNNNNNKDKTNDKDKDKDKPLDYDPKRHDVTDKDITVDNLPDKGEHKQTDKYDCVITCMQYLSDIVLKEGIIDKGQFEYNYEQEYGPSKKGIDSENLKEFVSSTYKTSDVNSYDEYKEAIENGKPVIATVNGSEEGVSHEVVVVGFPAEEDEDKDNDVTEKDETESDDENDDERPIIVYDPATGGYQEVPFGSIHDGSGMAIEGLK